MADSSDQMPKVNISKDKLVNASTVEWMKIIEKQNLARVQRLNDLKRRNRITGIGLGVIILSIYSYSIYAVKQETFLDDFEEPKLVASKEENKL